MNPQNAYAPPSLKPLAPAEGLGALHLFYRVDLTAWRDADRSRTHGSARRAGEPDRGQRAPETQTTVVTLSMLARADLGFMILTPDLHELNALEKKIAASLGPDVLIPEFTYLSLTERSEYTQKEDDYALELENDENIARGTPESEAKLAAFRERIAQLHARAALSRACRRGNIFASTR